MPEEEPMRREPVPVDETRSEDAELLRRYVAEKSETAFAELVRRHLDLVYSVALRQVGGDAHHACDVAQMVFTALARKAGELVDRPVLGGWLYRTTQFTAIDVVRTESRRRARETEAQTMHELTTQCGAEADWEKLRPTLDRAIGELRDDDRDAVVLRFFEGKSFAEVGARLRLSENAARMRVERALDKLHAALARRGVTSTAAALGVALANQAGVAAPAGLAASVTGAALVGAAASGGAGALLAIFTMSKIKIGIVGAIVAAVVVTGVVQVRANRELRGEVDTLLAGPEELGRQRTEREQLTTALARLEAAHPEAKELARLRQRVAVLEARPGWVVESAMRSVATAKNAGWATAEAGLETVLWAKAAGDREALVSNYAWVGEAKAKADAAFARLSEAVRAKYGSADRLAGTVAFGRAENADDPLLAYQPGVDPEARFARPGNILRIRSWGRMASGQERPVVTDLCYAGGSWTVGTSAFSEDGWQKMIAQIDPVTGDLLPAKN